MTSANGATPQTSPPEPQPWRTPEDAKGWQIVGVGKRHPRWLEFEIAAIASRHDPAGLIAGGAEADAYQAPARTLAERLRDLDPTALARDDVTRLTRETFTDSIVAQPAGDGRVYGGAMADEILTAWRAYAARMAEAVSS